ncbi:MAG TPA: SNF2-related protein [Pyrinomonadaceae bacterium]|jgi:superfamily II DNA or RNA helicase|nr:SNF2-related protein [Pyrinomonadaceae bacterium]
MSLKGRLAQEFAGKIRDRGFAYFRTSAVDIFGQSQFQVDARVKGGQVYLVRLKLGRASLNVACTCAYFEKGEKCKHVWATMLSADSLRYLKDADLVTPLNLVLDYVAVAELRKIALLLNPLANNGHDDRFRSTTSSASGPSWRRQLSLITNTVRATPLTELDDWSSGRELLYRIEPDFSRSSGKLAVEIGYRERTMKGEWGKMKSRRLPASALATLKDPADQQILAMLSGAKDGYWPGYEYRYGDFLVSNRFALPTALQHLVMPLMCATGRCVWRLPDKNAELQIIAWDDEGAWQFSLALQLDEATQEYVLRGVLRRGPEELRAAEEMKVASAILMTEGIVIGPDFRAARFDSHGARIWTDALRKSGEFRIPVEDSDDLVSHLLELPTPPKLDLPRELQFERVRLPPTPHLMVRKSGLAYAAQAHLEVDLLFDYQGVSISSSDRCEGIYDREARRFVERDAEAEKSAIQLLKPLGFRSTRDYNDNQKLHLSSKNLPRAVRTLLGQGWRVEAEGKLYRNPGLSSLSVSSGVDWFELHGSVDFGDGLEAKLPALLSALQRGESMIALGDGSFGLMPEKWLQKFGLLTSLGVASGDHLRFKQTQAGILDALLAAQPEITCDATFARVREEWHNFSGIETIAEPRGFVGALRDYQREGLGWFAFLERFGFGGCLADDMGLGKTVQVLALLESRRRSNGKQPVGKSLKQTRNKRGSDGSKSINGPSLVVVPRSLVFNWQQEAARFTPGLRVLTHTGIGRKRASAHFQDYDLVITTYGTLRRDAVQFQDADFDFVILDEAQAIKNARTEAAKAARLLKGKHRLALSGTPIENHLGELWSLFEFLNPGMLGAASVFQLSTSGARAPDDETRALLARALRPFLLRRTKQQVAKELPEKLEQTIYCEMDVAQRKQYDELRDFYRASLLEQVGRIGINRAKIQILEALLRLRQIACHPALVTGGSGDEPSAKLDVLMPQLREVTEEGHKALVFSQFTSFLAIVRRRLDLEGIDYEYLDGKTSRRDLAVERFQNDPKCKLFLISLKAGGQGLNLTAAEYVFLLDPWWNPAVEAQAIDRAHRIGQARRVFAYRLITRDTVEEKVLALQATKRELADAIINADNSLIRNITGEDLMLLLS